MYLGILQCSRMHLVYLITIILVLHSTIAIPTPLLKYIILYT